MATENKTYPITIKFNPNAKIFRFGIVVSNGMIP
jgi:hypothetical protein